MNLFLDTTCIELIQEFLHAEEIRWTLEIGGVNCTSRLSRFSIDSSFSGLRRATWARIKRLLVYGSHFSSLPTLQKWKAIKLETCVCTLSTLRVDTNCVIWLRRPCSYDYKLVWFIPWLIGCYIALLHDIFTVNCVLCLMFRNSAHVTQLFHALKLKLKHNTVVLKPLCRAFQVRHFQSTHHCLCGMFNYLNTSAWQCQLCGLPFY